MKVAACQLPDVRNDPRRALALVGDYTRRAEKTGADLVCFPECFLQGYDVRAEHVAEVAVDLGSPELRRALEAFTPLGPAIVLGLIERDGHACYNAAVVIARGAVIARYRKVHLLGGERAVFAPGEGPTVFDLAGARVALNICYDLCFASSVRSAAESGAGVLVCPCSNMMPRAKAEEWKPRHNEIRCGHARVQRVWIVSADVTGERGDLVSYGPTAVIDPRGTVVEQVPLMETGMVTAHIGSA